MEVAVACLRPRFWLVGAAAVLVLAAGALAAGTRLSSHPASRPGTVTVTRALPGGRGTLWLTAQWTSIKMPGDPVELGGFSARFSTCHRAGSWT
jgi:Tfp pilus assembly protein PilN